METCLVMARNNNTSMETWLKMPLVQLFKWIKANNEVIKKEQKERKSR